jgi:hypothetical protein
MPFHFALLKIPTQHVAWIERSGIRDDGGLSLDSVSLHL